MEKAEKLAANYRCSKCHHGSCCIREVVLPASAFTSFIMPRVGGKFLLVTCTLCGYTDMYDTAAYEEETEGVKIKKKKKNIVSDSA